MIPWPVIAKVYESLHWTILHQRHHNQMLCQVHRCLFQQAPVYLTANLSRTHTSTRPPKGLTSYISPILVQTSSDCHLSTRVPTTTTSCRSIYIIFQASTNDLIIQLYNTELFTPTIILLCCFCVFVCNLHKTPLWWM